MLLASYFKEEVSKIGKDILEVVSYENIYPLCKIMQAHRDRQSDVEHDKPPLILNPALTNEKPKEELESESKDKTLATEQDKEVLKQLLSSNEDIKKKNESLEADVSRMKTIIEGFEDSMQEQDKTIAELR